MADKKISDLGDGGLPQPTDEFVVARGATNNKIAWSSMSGGAGGVAIQASNATYTSGTVVVTGAGGGVTVGSNAGQQVQISVAAPVAQTVQTQNAVDVTLSGNTSGALALVSSGTLTFAGGNNITLSQNGNAITISGANAAGAQTGISGISASDTLYTSGSVRFTGSNAVTVKSGTGQLVVIDVPVQSTQVETQTFIGGISASNTLYTSGSVRITGVGGGITVSSNTGQRIDLSVAAQSVQPETQTFIGGIVGSNATYTSGTVTFTGVGGGVTVSSNTGQRVDISVAAPVAQTNQSGNVYASSNTFGTSSGTYDARSISIAGRGAVSVAASNSGWIISAPAQSVQPETQTFIGGISASDTLYTSGSVRFTGSNAVTVKSGTGQLVVIDVPTQTNQSGNVYASSNTFGTSSGTYDGRTVSIAGSGAVSVAASNSGWVISAPAQTAQTQGILAAGVSTGGNSSGDTGVASGTRLVFAGGNNITLSQGTAANATTITISAPNLGAGAFSGGVSTGGNTAGATGITGTQLVLVGSNNITLSQTTGANGGTVSIIGPNAGGFSAGASNLGNTAGSTGVTGTQLVLVGSGVITLSQSTDANGGTVSVLSPNGYVSNWPMQGATSTSAAHAGAMIATGATRTTLSAQIWPMGFEAALSVNRILIPIVISIGSTASNSNWSWTLGQSFGLYTMNAGTLSLVSSFSNQQQISYASTNNSTNASASWQMSYGSGVAVSSSSSLSTNNAGVTGFWSSVSSLKANPFAQGAHSFSGGQYIGAYGYSSTSAGGNVASFTAYGVNAAGNLLMPEIGLDVASVTAQSLLQGRVSMTLTNTALQPSFLSADATTATNNASILNRAILVSFLSH